MIAPVPPDPICVKIDDAARMIGVGRTKLYELIATNQIDVVKLGKSTRVTTASLHALVARQRLLRLSLDLQ
ncbi:MAG: helix-turn-helix domain-containing protein [Sphingobium sp.]|nr:MAG: helix-turn-helix domain-containing protein [Sphingobium sp.]